MQKLCFYRRVSVHRGGSGLVLGGGGGSGLWGEGVPALGGCLLQGVSAPGGGVCSGGCLLCTEAAPHLGETATAADGTHPTGMHSCEKCFSYETQKIIVHEVRFNPHEVILSIEKLGISQCLDQSEVKKDNFS